MSPLYYQEPDVTVSWDSRNRWIVADWRNRPSSGTVKAGCGEILNLLVLKRATAVLNDNTGITGSWVGASDWVAEEWLPAIIGSGLRKFAWVASPVSSLSVISAKRSVRKNEGGIIRLFHDAVEAEAWLRGKRASSARIEAGNGGINATKDRSRRYRG